MELTGTAALQAALLGAQQATAQAEPAEDSEFKALLREFDATQETEAERRARRTAEDRLAAERRARQAQLLELQAKIATLRSRVAGGGGPADQARLSMAQTELFWLTTAL